MSKIFESIKVSDEVRVKVDQRFESLDSESTEKGTTVDTSIGDDTLIGSVGERSEAEGDKSPETVDGDPIGLNIETKECDYCGGTGYDPYGYNDGIPDVCPRCSW